LLFWSLGAEDVWTLTFAGLREHADLLPSTTATVVALLLFVGATGKSAQIPLYVWLPDAMAGPTPVSALIHAATMVTAGVYMIARMSFLYAEADVALHVVASIGAVTAVFAATIGLAQNDIKKVLAYSTVSQLGYMFLGVGVGAFAAGIFHVMTHAFFKGLLFLGSGSVIHGMSGEQDIRKMGGLREKMPITFWTFAIGCAAIAGVPLLAGFFSKDAILYQAFTSHHGHWSLWLLGIVGAALTPFYMFRLLFLTFFGECRADEHTKHHIHESPPTMTIPLVVLAFLSVVGGWVGLPEVIGHDVFAEFLAPIVGKPPGHGSHALEWGLMAVSVAIGLGGIATAYVFYIARPELPGAVVRRARGIHELLLDKYRIDEIYHALIVGPALALARGLWMIIDVGVIDATVNGVASFLALQSEVWRRLQTGNVQHYAFTFLAGAVVLVGLLLVR
ncbi:MAG: NADH-quinone oxidoreductase subunit L, partial [Candidatus Binatia bacterium]